MICALLLAVTIPTWIAVLGTIALILLACYTLAGIFGPSPDYRIESGNELPANVSTAEGSTSPHKGIQSSQLSRLPPVTSNEERRLPLQNSIPKEIEY